MAYSMRQMRGLGAPTLATSTYREIAPGRYTTELTPYGVSSAQAPGAPQILVEEVYRIFGGSFRPRAGWGSGAQAGKIWLVFSTQDYLTPEGRGTELVRAAAAASGRVGGTLALPGQRPAVTSGGAPSSIALPADLITLSARDLQAELVRAGFNLGPAGVDGDFGTASIAALNAAVERVGIEGVRAKTRTSVTMTVHLWEALQALPDADAPDRPRRSTPRPPVVSPSAPPAPKSDFDWTTWGIVALAVAGLGAAYYYNRKQKRAAA